MGTLMAYGPDVVGLPGEVREWKYLGETTGQTQIDIPTDAQEVYALPTDTASSWNISIFFPTICGTNSYRAGFYNTSTNNGVALVTFLKESYKAYLNVIIFNGASHTTSAKTKWYVK